MIKAGITLLLGSFAAVIFHVAEVPYFDGPLFQMLCLASSAMSLTFMLTGFAWLEYPEFRRFFKHGEPLHDTTDLDPEPSYLRR
jgi:hypothetical protein